MNRYNPNPNLEGLANADVGHQYSFAPEMYKTNGRNGRLLPYCTTLAAYSEPSLIARQSLVVTRSG